MKIQIITRNQNLYSDESITVSALSRPRALDDFDVNVIDLSYKELWRYSNSSIGYLNERQDLCTIAAMVRCSNKTQIIYVYPQNTEYLYYYSQSRKKYNEREWIKNIIDNNSFTQGYRDAFPYENMGLKVVFGKTVTIIGEKEFEADFHFEYSMGETITTSKCSEKITTIKYDEGLFYTTLNICETNDKIYSFLDYVFSDDKETDIPKWVKDFEYGNDLEQKRIIESSKEQIIQLQQTIEAAESVIEENNKYKSILCNNGDALVKVVFEILEELFNYDLSNFVDEKREDFLIEKEGDVFIGEIKGVSSNVKNDNITQLEVHFQSYIDNMPETENVENVHAVLVINPLRNKELKEREPIHERQIALAKRNGSLIVETVTLLKMFELFQRGAISSTECIGLFKNKTGLLSIKDFM